MHNLGATATAGMGESQSDHDTVTISYNDYFTDRFRYNTSMLAVAGELAERKIGHRCSLYYIYNTLMEEGIRSPISKKDITQYLKSVKLQDEEGDDAIFSDADAYTGYHGEEILYPSIRMNFSNPDVYIGDHERSGDMTGLTELFMEMSAELGVKYEDMINSEYFCSAFIFLHEFGHAVDHISKYVSSKAVDSNNMTINGDELYDTMVREGKRRRMRERRTKLVFSRDISQSVRDEYCRDRGINPQDNREKLLYKAAEYRRMPDEHFADSFAYRFIRSHPEQFFTLDPNEHDSGRLFLHLNERMYLGKDFSHITGITEGRRIRIRQIPRNDNLQSEYFVTETPKIGEPLRLSRLGAEDITKPTVISSSPISRVYSIVEQIPGDGISGLDLKNTYYMDLEDGKKMAFECPSAHIPVDYEREKMEMLNDLELRPGDRVQLLKISTLLQGRSSIEDGALLNGYVSNNNGTMVLTDSDGRQTHTVIPLESFKKWKTWYIKDLDSLYEILPPEKHHQRRIFNLL